jgi:predicted metal-dependent hydrolase
VTQLLDRAPRIVEVDGERLEVRVRESLRARTSRIIVGPNRPLEIIVPQHLRDADVDRILAERHAWIRTKTAKARSIAARPERLGLGQPGVVWLDLTPIPVYLTQTTAFDAGPVSARLARDHLDVGPMSFSSPDNAAAIAVERWYRREARTAITETADREARRLGLRYQSIAIRDQRTRWGSCSRRGNLSFNWRLAIAPQDILDYVVVHELCHLREPNHSKAFWRLLDAAIPGWQAHARWLRENGHELHGYDPRAAVGLAAPPAQ